MSLNQEFLQSLPSDALVECVPNFSEGRRPEVIAAIRDAIAAVQGVQVLHVDPGAAANRTVITLVGAPAAVVDAMLAGMKTCLKFVDMRTQHGEHPRLGAIDVCPLVPLRNITLKQTARLAHHLARRAADELNLPIYCYEAAATHPERRLLARVRRGEYEGIPKRLAAGDFPDYGPTEFQPTRGATILGARPFLIAYNVNLATADAKIAREIAKDVRESGRVVLNDAGEKQRVSGSCKSLRAIGWYIEEYGRAQVSLNVTDMDQTPVHRAFEAVKTAAVKYGVAVTGSELIGLAPLRVFLEAGRFYANDPQLPEAVAVPLAVERLGLTDLTPFRAEERIIEYLLDAPV